ncbi:Hypothetical protein, putative [Bodo saltans]|uniref:Uncharacterized protein n=1 Tax=Bodo saltans TaxID=75058 RepID=A0A0S4JI26_BODSA|nr:Hypothetical protein, putative [Bodo saltans]|eukprot:CUG91153.1 Hypothetical protein, putative [Bodo saltans]
MCSHQHFAFPRNRLFPPLVASDVWRLSPHTYARVVRVAPKSSFPAHTGMILKVLRGETNEVPTPLAPCKACRSCSCPDYLSDVIAGSEGAILLVSWEEGAGAELKELEQVAVDVAYTPNTSQAADGCIESSFSLFVEEGESYVCELQFHRNTATAPSASSSVKRYHEKGDGLFGEVAVAISGPLAVEWHRVEEDETKTRTLKVPAGYEYGPFYSVDAEGHLCRLQNGQLIYAPHKFVLEKPGSVWATVRLPVVKSDVAGPHRHCYT